MTTKTQTYTSEFQHYTGCKGRDPMNCSGCALTTGGKDGPNYVAWPLAYMENYRIVPAKWRDAFKREMSRTDNPAYAAHLVNTLRRLGVAFSDGKGLEETPHA